MTLGKTFLGFSAALIEWMSGGRFLVGPSLLVFAGKKELPSSAQVFRMRTRILLKTLALHFLAVLGYLLGLPLWLRLLGRNHDLKVLLYHSVDEFKVGDMNTRTSQFEKQMNFLKERFDVISQEEALEFLKKGELPQRASVVITFDDGYSNNYHTVFPILKSKGLTAAFSMLAIEDRDKRVVTHLKNMALHESQLMTWDEAKEMAGSGMSFGSHGESHRRLVTLPNGKLRHEIFSSKEKIEAALGRKIRFFSYPYGMSTDFDDRVKESVEKAGYEAAFSAVFGTNGLKSDLFSLKRIGVEASDTVFTLRAKLNGALGMMVLFDFPLIRKTIRWMNAVFFRDMPAVEEEDPILLVSVDFPPHTDGVSTISRELSIQIAAAGAKMFIIGPQDKGDKEFDACYQYRAFRVPGYHWGYFRFIPVFFRMPVVVFRYGIKKIFAMNIAYGGLLSWLLSFLKRLDYVIFAYGYEFEKVKRHFFAKQLYLKIYGRAKAIVCCSRIVRERLISFGVEPDKIKVLYPAVDFGRYYPCDVPRNHLEEKGVGGRKILLTTGRLVERKGHDQVIRALPEIIKRFPDVLYCISGIGPNEENLRKIAQESGVVDYVRFLGRLPEKELLYLYNTCELFIMPSREIEKEGHIEGFGIVFLEANACGKPVIGGRSGGVLEAIREGETGLLVNPDSRREIAEKVIFLLSRPDEARKMGNRGLDWVRKNFNWEQYVRESYEFLCGKELK